MANTIDGLFSSTVQLGQFLFVPRIITLKEDTHSELDCYLVDVPRTITAADKTRIIPSLFFLQLKESQKKERKEPLLCLQQLELCRAGLSIDEDDLNDF